MHDISDPAGAGRGDRRQARRLVDEAYAAGRISAIDRSLRVEQIDAASTRGDLAMIVRDLEGGAQDRAPSSSAGVDRTPPPVPPVPAPPSEPVDVPRWPEPRTPEAARSWPPPTFTPAGGAGGPVRTNKTLVGCLVAVVLLLFLGPCLVGLLTFGFAVVSTDGSSSSSSSSSVGSEQEIGPIGGTYAGGYTWGDFYGGLDETVGTTEVVRLAADQASATAVVEEAGGQVTWTWQDGEWVRGLSTSSGGAVTTVDLSALGASVLESAMLRVRAEQALTDTGTSMFTIDAFGATPRITMTVSAADGSGTGTFPLDELG